MPAQVGRPKASGKLPEQDKSMQQRMDAHVGKAQARGALTAGGDRTIDGLKGISLRMQSWLRHSISRSLRLAAKPISRSF
jgi:hypothetical protein